MNPRFFYTDPQGKRWRIDNLDRCKTINGFITATREDGTPVSIDVRSIEQE